MKEPVGGERSALHGDARTHLEAAVALAESIKEVVTVHLYDELGPPEMDLAWFLWHDRFMAGAFGSDFAGRHVDPLPGAPSTDEAVAWYARVAGHMPQHLEWFEMFAGYRMGVYLMRHGIGLISTGKAPARSRLDHRNSASAELERMLDAAADGSPRT